MQYRNKVTLGLTYFTLKGAVIPAVFFSWLMISFRPEPGIFYACALLKRVPLSGNLSAREKFCKSWWAIQDKWTTTTLSKSMDKSDIFKNVTGMCC